MTAAPEVRVATDEAFVLAEGPVWDPRRGLLRWVDIRSGLVLGGILEGDGRIRIVERVALEAWSARWCPPPSTGASGRANGDDLVGWSPATTRAASPCWRAPVPAAPTTGRMRRVAS